MTTTRRWFEVQRSGRPRAWTAAATALLATGLLGFAAPAFAEDEVPVDDGSGYSLENPETTVDPIITPAAFPAPTDPGFTEAVIAAYRAALAGERAFDQELTDATVALGEINKVAKDPTTGAVIATLEGAGFWVQMTYQPVVQDPAFADLITTELGSDPVQFWDFSPIDLLTGQKWEPDEGTTVRVYLNSLPATTESGLAIARLNADGTTEELPLQQDTVGWFFDTSEFSKFALVRTEPSSEAAALIGLLNNLPATITANDVARVVQITEEFNAMATSNPTAMQEVLADATACPLPTQTLQATITPTCPRLNEAQRQAGVLNHETSEATLEGTSVPWNVKLVTRRVANTENVYRNLVNALTGRNVLGLWEIAPVDLLQPVANATGTYQAWVPAAGSDARIYLKNFAPGTATDLRVSALNSDGTLTTLALTQDNTTGTARWWFTPTASTRYGVSGAGTTTSPTSPTTTPTTTVTPTTLPSQIPFANCTEVWNTLGRPILSTEARFQASLDHDGDGTGCEIDPRGSNNSLLDTGVAVGVLAGGVALAAAGTTLAVRSRRKLHI